MSIRTDVYALCAALASGNVFWAGTVPEQQPAGYIVLSVINTDPQNTMDSNTTDLANVRLQVDIWAATAAAADALATAAIAAMTGATGLQALLINDFDAYEPEQKMPGRTLEFSAWNN